MESNSYWESLKFFINSKDIHSYIKRQAILALSNVKASTTADYYRNLLEKVGYIGKTNKPGIYCVLRLIPVDLSATDLRVLYETRFSDNSDERKKGVLKSSYLVEEVLKIKYFKRTNNTTTLEVISYDNVKNKFLVHWVFGSIQPFKVDREFINKVDFIPANKEDIEKVERHRCPRRDESVAGLDKGNLDGWEERQPGLRFCSFCGSLHPESFIDLIKQYGRSILESSIKNYKIYLNVNGNTYKYYRQHDTEGLIERVNDLLGY
jgi:hypothetical protein